jgi:hypothetical protein
MTKFSRHDLFANNLAWRDGASYEEFRLVRVLSQINIIINEYGYEKQLVFNH